MSVNNWIGGTTAVAEVLTTQATLTWAANDTITTTLTAEDGTTTQAVSTNTTSSTIETGVIDPHITSLQASNQSLFSAITWVKSSTDKVQGTAKIEGVPFYMAGSNVTAGNGLFTTEVTSTANAGPNDWNTAANFTDASESAAGSIPGTDDDVKVLPHPSDVDNASIAVSYDVLFGLDQNGVDLNTLRIPRSYKGSIGDSANGYYLRIDVTSNDSAGKTVINSNCPALWLKGTHTQMNVVATRNTVNALRLAGGTITDLRILGSGVTGTIKIANSTVVTNAYILGVGSARIVFGTSGSAHTIFNMDSGVVENDAAITTLTLGGGQLTHLGGIITTGNNHGGYIFYNATENNVTWNNYQGTLDLSQNMADSLSIGTTAVSIWDGLITDRGGLANVTYGSGGAGITLFGGSVQSETATLIVVS